MWQVSGDRHTGTSAEWHSPEKISRLGIILPRERYLTADAVRTDGQLLYWDTSRMGTRPIEPASIQLNVIPQQTIPLVPSTNFRTATSLLKLEPPRDDRPFDNFELFEEGSR
jgi:hypothetical protein